MVLLWLSFLPVYFGLAIYAAVSSVLVLATGAEPSWPWWAALFPLALSHALSGFLVMWQSTRTHPGPLFCAVMSGGTTVMAMVVAVGAAYGTGLSMPRHIAVMIQVAASLAGLLGLALATRTWLDSPRD